MAEVEEKLADLERVNQAIRECKRRGYLMLIDLAGSTAYKTAHSEPDWLHRLFAFYTVVKNGLAPTEPTKYIGDGIFSFVDASERVTPSDFLRLARKILDDLNRLNEQQFPGDHAIHARIVINYGEVFLFFDNDPQGTAVDKLFRMEKFVPTDAIGLTEEFVRQGNEDLSTLQPVAHVTLKGLANRGEKHTLYLDGVHREAELRDNLRQVKVSSQCTDTWWLPRATEDKIYLVGGSIPPGEEGQPTVQAGDKDALLQTLQVLTLSGDPNKIQIIDSIDFPDDKLGESVVLIGGPYYNDKTRLFLEESDIPLQFQDLESDTDETPLVHASGARYEKCVDSRQQLVRDWGLFARIKNPYNREVDIIIACGIESPAVYGIVSIFTPAVNPNFRKLYEHICSLNPDSPAMPELPQFACVIGFRIMANGKPAMPTFNEQIAHIYIV